MKPEHHGSSSHQTTMAEFSPTLRAAPIAHREYSKGTRQQRAQPEAREMQVLTKTRDLYQLKYIKNPAALSRERNNRKIDVSSDIYLNFLRSHTDSILTKR